MTIEELEQALRVAHRMIESKDAVIMMHQNREITHKSDMLALRMALEEALGQLKATRKELMEISNGLTQ